MAREFAKPFYRSKAWQRCRESYIAKVHGLCERCEAQGRIVPGKILHHKIYLTPENIHDPNISLNHDNLEFLCHDCHNREHLGGGVTAEDVMFDEYGNLVPRERAFDNSTKFDKK